MARRRGNPVLTGIGLALSTLGTIMGSANDEEEKERLRQENIDLQAAVRDQNAARQREQGFVDEVQQGLGSPSRPQMERGAVALQDLIGERGGAGTSIPGSEQQVLPGAEIQGPGGVSAEIPDVMTPAFVPRTEGLAQEQRFAEGFERRRQEFDQADEARLFQAAMPLIQALPPDMEGTPVENATVAVLLAADSLDLDVDKMPIDELAEKLVGVAGQRMTEFGEERAAAEFAGRERAAADEARPVTAEIRRLTAAQMRQTLADAKEKGALTPVQIGSVRRTAMDKAMGLAFPKASDNTMAAVFGALAGVARGGGDMGDVDTVLAEATASAEQDGIDVAELQTRMPEIIKQANALLSQQFAGMDEVLATVLIGPAAPGGGGEETEEEKRARLKRELSGPGEG